MKGQLLILVLDYRLVLVNIVGVFCVCVVYICMHDIVYMYL